MTLQEREINGYTTINYGRFCGWKEIVTKKIATLQVIRRINKQKAKEENKKKKNQCIATNMVDILF